MDPRPGDRSASDPPEGGGTWPPTFPHVDIDRLIDRLESERTLDSAEAYRLLALVAQEAQRLRATAVRLTTAKLAEADREARTIVAEALAHAEEMRELGLAVLNARLDDGEQVLATMREACKVERRASELARAESERGWSFRSLADRGDVQ